MTIDKNLEYSTLSLKSVFFPDCYVRNGGGKERTRGESSQGSAVVKKSKLVPVLLTIFWIAGSRNLVPDVVLFRLDFTGQSEQQVQPGRKRCLMPWVEVVVTNSIQFNKTLLAWYLEHKYIAKV